MLLLFGDHVLDPQRRELRRASETVSVGPQVFDLLLHLIENRARVVSKDDLLEAVWRGRIVSESTITSHINAARTAIGDNGQDQRFIKTVARKGFRFIGDVTEAAPTAGATAGVASPGALALPDTPSIAVLPFANMSGEAEEDYFADGMVEDIITALSRMRWLFVIARNSSFTYKNRANDVKQVGRDLGVRYVLEGSVRRSTNRVRITGQLIDATTGGHLWAERYDGTLDDIFDLQDRITASVVGAIASQLERAELERSRRKPTENLDAYDYYLRGMARFHAGGPENIGHAFSRFSKSIALDADYASAYGMAAWCLFTQRLNGWTSEVTPDVDEGVRLARCAVELGKDDAVALARGGHALAHFTRDLDLGMDFLDRSLVLNPNLATTWFLSGYLRAFSGETDEAMRRLEYAMRLSPLDPEMFRMQICVALAHLLARRFEEASIWAAKAYRDKPVLVLPGAVIAACHALCGRMDEAGRAMQHLRAIHPELRVGSLDRWLPFRRPEDATLFNDALRNAGLAD